MATLIYLTVIGESHGGLPPARLASTAEAWPGADASEGKTREIFGCCLMSDYTPTARLTCLRIRSARSGPCLATSCVQLCRRAVAKVSAWLRVCGLLTTGWARTSSGTPPTAPITLTTTGPPSWPRLDRPAG